MAKQLGLILCLMVLGGCAATQKSSSLDLQAMQSRVDFLEEELKTKDQEITDIQNELRQVKQESEYKRADVYEAPTRRITNYEASASTGSGYDADGIIRVEGVSANQLQQALKQAGFYQGALDGKIGQKTKEAIKAFQRDNDLAVDGIVGRGTWAKLKNNL
jgi:murein L,D-transpeptidase YcbB/YkuD